VKAAKTGGEGSLARGAAIITAATLVSRLTGFVRVVVVAGAMGTTFLANTYQTANTAPNLMFELLAAGVLTSIFVPTFIEYLVKDEREEGWHAANVLTTVALVGLTILAAVLALAAPWIMRVLTIGVDRVDIRAREVALGTDFLRLFAPQVVFYGAGMIMTGALHAHRRFAMAAIAPIFNNLVVIGVYITYAVMRGDKPPTIAMIDTSEMWILGAGTTLGVVVMTVCLVPQLMRLGWRYRWRFDRSHPAVRKAMRLGVWALGYAGGYQAGLIVVLILANRVEGGVAAYQWAYTFFYVPHALFAAPIFHVLFPAMTEHATKGETSEFTMRLKDGLDMLTFVLLPVAALMLIVAVPLAKVCLEFGVMSGTGAALIGRVIAAFAIGLPAYSAFLVLTRAYYAHSDTKTPTLVNAATVAVSSAVGAILFFVLSSDWSVAGLAFGHSVGFFLGTGALAYLLSRRLGARMSMWWSPALARALLFGTAAAGAMWLAGSLVPAASKGQALGNVLVVSVVGMTVYGALMLWAKSPELLRVTSVVKRRRS
jgi:putative peptidoglycan lipid II flippase